MESEVTFSFLVYFIVTKGSGRGGSFQYSECNNEKRLQKVGPIFY
jgi:hypothetical protein